MDGSENSKPSGIGRWGAYLDRQFRHWAEYSMESGVILLIIGALLAMLAWMLGVGFVQFDGNLKYGATISAPPGFEDAGGFQKEVGYFWAPNWGLTGVLFLPYAVFQILKARHAIERVIMKLIEQRMLVTRSYAAPEPADVLANWSKVSRTWTIVGTVVGLVVFLFVVHDFITVVSQWIITNAETLRPLAISVHLHHTDFEFDWSVASSFSGTTVSQLGNFTFSLVAYIVIAAFGASFLFAAFFYLISFGIFFQQSRLEKRGLRLIPNPKSPDPRRGFENFEEFFDPLILGAAATGVIALSMMMQNVYLRAVEHGNILSMVFGPFAEYIKGAGGSWIDLIKHDLLVDIGTLSGYGFKDVPLQIYATPLILMILVFIVFVVALGSLKGSATAGQKDLLSHGADDVGPVAGMRYAASDYANLKERLKIWPVSWVRLRMLWSCFVVLVASMIFPRLIALIVAFALYGAISRIKAGLGSNASS